MKKHQDRLKKQQAGGIMDSVPASAGSEDEIAKEKLST